MRNTAITIHTYKGYRFRSRTEFSWAQEWDARGLVWEYETVTFRTDEGSYTPDFVLGGGAFFVEIKVDGARNIHNRFHLCTPPLLLIFGLPTKYYIRLKPAGASQFLPGRIRSFDLALLLVRKAAA